MEKSRKRRGKSAAVVAIAVAAGILCGLILYVLLLAAAVEPGVVGVVMVLLYALVVLAVLAGVIYVAVQRLREIQSGEEDEASQY